MHFYLPSLTLGINAWTDQENDFLYNHIDGSGYASQQDGILEWSEVVRAYQEGLWMGQPKLFSKVTQHFFAGYLEPNTEIVIDINGGVLLQGAEKVFYFAPTGSLQDFFSDA